MKAERQMPFRTRAFVVRFVLVCSGPCGFGGALGSPNLSKRCWGFPGPRNPQAVLVTFGAHVSPSSVVDFRRLHLPPGRPPTFDVRSSTSEPAKARKKPEQTHDAADRKPQGNPGVADRGPTGSQRDPKGCQKRAKGGPRGARGSPKGAKREPKRAPGSPKACQKRAQTEMRSKSLERCLAGA